MEVFRIRTEEEIKKKQARRRRRAKEKEQEKKEKGKKKGEDVDAQMDAEPEEKAVELVDLFQPYLIVRASGKVRSFDFGEEEVGGKGNTQLFVALSSNALEVYNIPPPTKSKDAAPEASRVFSVDLPGHRTDVRTLCLSSDDALLASASNGTSRDLSSLRMTDEVCRITEDLEHEDHCLHTHDGLRLCGVQHLPSWRPSGRSRNKVRRDPDIRHCVVITRRYRPSPFRHGVVDTCSA